MKARSDSCIGSMWTRVNLFRNERGKPRRPPPSCRGFWAANRRKVGGQWKVRPSSGMNTSARWSRMAFSPSSTLWPAWAYLQVNHFHLSSSARDGQRQYTSCSPNAQAAHAVETCKCQHQNIAITITCTASIMQLQPALCFCHALCQSRN